MMWRFQTSSHAVRFWASVQLTAIIVLLFAVGVLGWFAIQTHDSLCNFKLDLEVRQANTEQFVTDIEEGRRQPIPGISLADLKRSLEAQTRTLSSLSDLDCN